MAKHRYLVLAGAVALTGLVAAGCSSSSKSSSPTTAAPTGSTAPAGSTATTGGSGTANNTASAPGITPTTIKIGFITSATGNASSTFNDSAAAAKAAYDAQNAAGGINGRKIEMVVADDTSSATGNLSAVQSLISRNVSTIEPFSPYDFGGYKVANAAHIPITGGCFDGPEWGQQPNTNMFCTSGGTNGNVRNTGQANFYKDIGAHNVGALAYGISPSSTQGVKNFKIALEKIGLTMGYENLSVPFGGVDVTGYVLAMKQAGVDAAGCSCVQSTNLALFTALRQAGMGNVKVLSFSSADNSVFSSGATAAAAAQGAYYPSQIPPLDQNNAATNTMLNNLKTYDPSYKGGYPSYGATGSYLAAELMIKGLEVAGQNPTRQSFITNLSQVTGWDANGLLASPVSFNHFGTPEQTHLRVLRAGGGHLLHQQDRQRGQAHLRNVLLTAPGFRAHSVVRSSDRTTGLSWRTELPR